MSLQRFNLNESDRAIPPTPKEVYDFIKSRDGMRTGINYFLDGQYAPVNCYFNSREPLCNCHVHSKFTAADDSRLEGDESLLITLDRTWRENPHGEHEVECYTYADCQWRKNFNYCGYPHKDSQEEYLILNFEANSRAEAMERFFKLLEVWKQQRKEK